MQCMAPILIVSRCLSQWRAIWGTWRICITTQYDTTKTSVLCSVQW